MFSVCFKWPFIKGKLALQNYKTTADYWQKESEKTLLANTRLELKVKKLEEENLALRDELATECVERQELISSMATLQVKLSLAEEKLHSEVTSLQNKVAVLEDELRVKSAEAMLKAGCKCRLLLAVSDGELADEGNK